MPTALQRRCFSLHSTQSGCQPWPFQSTKVYKVITTMLIRPLDDRTCCARSAFTHLGLLHHFTATQCVLKCALLMFSSISTCLVVVWQGTFRSPWLQNHFCPPLRPGYDYKYRCRLVERSWISVDNGHQRAYSAKLFYFRYSSRRQAR